MPATDQPLFRAKDLFWTLYLGPGRWTARLLPLDWMRRGGFWLLPLSRLVSRQLRRRPSPGFARYPALREKIPNSDLLIQAHTANAMERAIDDLLLERHPVAQLVLQMEINGTEHLERALAAGRGVLLSSGHFFSSRLAKQVLTLRGWPVISIRDLTFDDPAVGRWGKLQLLPRYYHFLHRIIREEIDSKDPECTLKILARLRAGGIVDVHVDAPFRRNAHPMPFLGTSQWFPKGFLEIAHRNGTPVVPWLSLGNSRKLKIEFYPPLFPEAGSPVEILEQLVRLLEKQVVENPEQWEYTIRL